MATQTANKIKIVENGVERILEGDELESFLAQRAKDEVKIAAMKAADQERKAQKEALLERLGITADEAILLLS
jgi:antitoxin component of RelBE/YafQ-DinJ toxin-antitoxin module